MANPTLRQRIEAMVEQRRLKADPITLDDLTAALAIPDAAPGEGQCNHGALSGVLVGVNGVWTEHPHPHAAIWLDAVEHPPTAQCPDMECMVCGMRDCPDQEPLHYHHDGCPCCTTKQAKPADPHALTAEEWEYLAECIKRNQHNYDGGLMRRCLELARKVPSCCMECGHDVGSHNEDGCQDIGHCDCGWRRSDLLTHKGAAT